MTTLEHTLVGIHVAFATGLHRLIGWRGVAIAGAASNIPDWDGIPMLIDMQRFESGHRVWGHSLLSIVVTSILLGFSQMRWDWMGWIADRFRRQMPETDTMNLSQHSDEFMGMIGGCVFALIAMCAQCLHLPCDMVVSGGKGLSDWPIQPLWPFSRNAYVYPLIPWGDVGPTIIMMLGVIVSAKRSGHLIQTSAITLAILCGYLVARGMAIM